MTNPQYQTEEDLAEAERRALIEQMASGGSDPSVRMHGNQPGVAQATGGTMQVQTDFSKLGPDRYSTTSQAAGTPEAQAALASMAGPSAPTAASPAGWGSYAVEGTDFAKRDAGHSSPKYDMLRTLSGYDPKGGITDEAWAALEALGIMGQGAERLSGDKIRLGQGADPRFNGVTEIDFVRNLTGDGDAAWQYGAYDPNARTATGSGARMAGFGSYAPGQEPGINSLFPMDQMTYKTLQDQIQQILGGQQMFDRDMLLSLLR